MKNDPLSDVHTFVIAAEAGNFTRAARLLKLDPSAVSKSVTRLEAKLGVRLFHRSPRQIALTGDGEHFFSACRQGLNTIEDASNALTAQDRPWRGKLRLSAPISFGQYLLAPALSPWLAERPGLDIELILTDRHVDMTAERFDLSVMLGDVPDSRLVARPLPIHRFFTVAAPDYLERNGTPQKPEDLTNHVCLPYLMANSGQFRAWTFEGSGRRFQHFPTGPLATDHAAVLLSMAESGLGIIQAPSYVVDSSLRSGKLVLVLEDFHSQGAPLTIVQDQTRLSSARTNQTIAFLLSLGPQL